MFSNSYPDLELDVGMMNQQGKCVIFNSAGSLPNIIGRFAHICVLSESVYPFISSV